VSYPLVRRTWALALRTKTRVLSTPLAACFALGLVLIEFVMLMLPNADQTSIARAASTNITHLAIDPLFVLPASAFVDLGNTWLWVPLTLILLGGLERKLGPRRALLIAFGGHAIATLISEGMLLTQIAWHAAPRSDVDILDVGPSYVILATMAACLILGSWKLRLGAVLSGAIVIPGLLVGINSFDMSAVGHLSSLILGTLFALAYTARGRTWIAGHRRSLPKPALVLLRKPATA
jgi:hypothetical protein